MDLWNVRDWVQEGLRVIGVIHLLPLPGSPRYQGSMAQIMDRALEDADALIQGGVHAILVENFGDVPFWKDRVPEETLSAFTVVAYEIRKHHPLPMGINLLRNASRAALSVAHAVGAQFIRINVPIGARLTPEGWIEGRMAETARLRSQLGTSVAFFEDVHVKHSWPVGQEPPLRDLVEETVQRGVADALIVTGPRTGEEVDPKHLKEVYRYADVPVFAGSGVTTENLARIVRSCHGVIVGTTFKKDGNISNPVDPARVQQFMDRVHALTPS